MTKQLYVIDKGISDYQVLVDELPEGSDYLLIEIDQDGIRLLAQYVSSYHDLDTIHILSHGSSGELQLGNAFVNNSNLSDYEGLLEGIGNSLTEKGSLLIYGCNVAKEEDGKKFLDRIYAASGKNLAASTNSTANNGFDGDNNLEYQLGFIDTENFFELPVGFSKLSFQKISFSEYPIGTKNPIYKFSHNEVSFVGEILSDGAQPDSPVIGANSRFDGPVYISFKNLVSSVQFEAGYLDELGSITVEFLGQNGKVIERKISDGLGIQNFYHNDNGGISGIRVLNSNDDSNGFSVDNLVFNGSVTTGASFIRITDETERTEGYSDTGSWNMSFAVIREGDLSGPASVDWDISDFGEFSVNADDFHEGIIPSGTISFSEGQERAWIFLRIKGDNVIEPTEKFKVTLSNPIGGTLTSEYFSIGIVETDEFANAAIDTEFEINTHFPGNQFGSRVSSLPDGGWVVIWKSINQIYHDTKGDIFGQRYRADGTKNGPEFQINTFTDKQQLDPDVTFLTDGGWVVVWESEGQDSSGYGVFAQRYNSDGTTFGDEFQVNSFTSGSQSNPKVTTTVDGGWIVVWHSANQDGSGTGIYGQRYGFDNKKLGDEFLINSHIKGHQIDPSIITLVDGGYVVVWGSYDETNGFFGQRFDADFDRYGAEFSITSIEQGSVQGPYLTELADGGWLVFWGEYSLGIFGQRYHSNGSKYGDVFQISTANATSTYPAASALPDGGWVVVWEYNKHLDGSADGVFGQRFNSDGTKFGEEFQINSYSRNDQGYPSVETLPDGDWLVTWSSNLQDGSGLGLYGQRFNSQGQKISVEPGDEVAVETHGWSDVIDGELRLTLPDGSIIRCIVNGNSIFTDTFLSVTEGDLRFIPADNEDNEIFLFSGDFSYDFVSQQFEIVGDFESTFKLAGFNCTVSNIHINNGEVGCDLALEFPEAFGLTETLSGFQVALNRSGVNFGKSPGGIDVGSKVEFPDVSFDLLKVLEIEADDMFIEYHSVNDQIILSGEFNIDAGWEKFDLPAIGADFEEIVFEGGELRDVELEVNVEDFSLYGWGVNDLNFFLSTSDNYLSAGGEVDFPRPLDFGLGADVGFTLNPFELDRIYLEADLHGRGIPIASTGFNLTGIGAGLSNLSSSSQAPVLLSGELELKGLTGLMELELSGELDQNHIAGEVVGHFRSPEILSFSAWCELIWKGNRSLSFGGDLYIKNKIDNEDNIESSLISGGMEACYNFDTKTLTSSGNAQVAFKFGKLKGDYRLVYSDDNDSSNDGVQGWITKTTESGINIYTGVTYTFDGNTDFFIGGRSLPLISSWVVDHTVKDLLVEVEWENSAANPVKTRVIVYDNLDKTLVRTVIEEEEYELHGIEVISDWSTETLTYIYIGEVEEGLWDVEIINPEGLGEISYSASTSHYETRLTLGDVSITDYHVSVSYSAINPNSNAEIYFYIDENNQGFDGQLIGVLPERDIGGEFQWDASGYAPGDYYIYATMADMEIIPVSTYAAQSFVISNFAASGIVVIEGTATVGGTLIANTDEVEDLNGLGFLNYQWLRDGVVIEGATSLTYSPSEDDVGNKISVQVSFTDSGGTQESITSLTTPVITLDNSAPAGSIGIIGRAEEDSVLSISSSLEDADGLGEFNYQWKRNDESIAGANELTHKLTQADVGSAISVSVTYIDGEGTFESILSHETTLVTNLNDGVDGDVVIVGDPLVGETLYVEHSLTDEDGLGLISYQWKANGSDIPDAIDSSLLLDEDLLGNRISVIASYVDDYGVAETASSSFTDIVAKANSVSVGWVSVDGESREGSILSAKSSIIDNDGVGEFKYQWFKNGIAITDARESTYVIKNADVGADLNVKVEFIDNGGSLESFTSGSKENVTAFTDVIFELIANQSSEFAVQAAYVAYYGRPADPGGLINWVEHLERSGGELANIIEAFGNSLEFEERYGDLSSRELVNQIYIQLFNRPAEEAGLNSWSAHLESGSKTIQSIALDILLGARNSDALSILKKIEFAGTFTEKVATGEFKYAGSGHANTIKEILFNVGAETNPSTFEGLASDYKKQTAVIQLNELDGSNGFVLHGASFNGRSGFDVSAVGDFNGDGLDDIIIGAHEANTNGNDSGESYVVFGQRHGWESSFNLSDLDGSNGFVLTGVNENDYFGFSVSGAGDFNGDGLDDIIVGAPLAEINDYAPGVSYVIFGQSHGWDKRFYLSDLDGNNGFALYSANDNNRDRTGFSVSTAGDFNGDGLDDILIGSNNAKINGHTSGASYVVFGQDDGWDSSFNLSDLDGSNGLVLHGIDRYDRAGFSVSNAGDFNGDGLTDIIIGAKSADPNGDQSGESYIVFGQSHDWESSFNLSNLDGSNGFVLNGIDEDDESGKSVSAIGDFNGDGLDDIIIGANYADPSGNGSGGSYVVFGQRHGWESSFNLSDLDGSNGFVLTGVSEGDSTGFSVSGAGDFNGDGLDDIIIGAHNADPNGDSSGAGYVVFGQDDGWDSSFNLSDLDGSNGLVLHGIDRYDRAGISVSNAGDFNGDGLTDIIIGADMTSNATSYALGSTYLVFGGFWE